MTVTVLGFDFGLRRIGVAVGQSVTQTANPLTILLAREGIPDWDDIAALISEWQPDALIVGYPLNMDDSKNEITIRANKFGNRLHGRFGLQVHLVDERLSTIAAREMQPDREHVDDISASLIVETWLKEHP